MKPDILKIQTFVKRQSGWIAFFLLLLLTGTCGSNAVHDLVIKERDAQNKVFEKEKDSLDQEIKSRDKVIASNDKAMDQNAKDKAKLEKELLAEKAKGQKLIAKVKNYNLKDWKKFYQEKTGYGDADIYVDGNALKITRAPLTVIANELITGDVVRANLKTTQGLLAETKHDLGLMTSNYNEEKAKNSLLKQSSKLDEQIKNNLEKNVSDLKTDLKKAKRPKLVPILIGVGAGVVGGILIAK